MTAVNGQQKSGQKERMLRYFRSGVLILCIWWVGDGIFLWGLNFIRVDHHPSLGMIIMPGGSGSESIGIRHSYLGVERLHGRTILDVILMNGIGRFSLITIILAWLIIIIGLFAKKLKKP